MTHLDSEDFFKNVQDWTKPFVPWQQPIADAWEEENRSDSGTRVDCPGCTGDPDDHPVSRDETRTTSSTGGQKGVKRARFDLIPVGPLWELAELYGKGAEKYEDRNWEKGYEWSKSFAAMMRHAWLFWNGQDNDEETGKPHMASVAFHAFTLIEFSMTHPSFDDRPIDGIEHD